MEKCFIWLLSILFFIVIGFVSGCGSNATGGGSSGGGSDSFTANIYVSSSTGSDDAVGAGSSITNPYKTIDKAMSVVQTGEVIGLMVGSYSGSVIWTLTSEGVTLRGQHTSTTTIDAASSGICLDMTGLTSSQTVTVEGITIKNGNNAGAGAGISVNNANLHIKNVYFINNIAQSGAAIYMSGSTNPWLFVENSYFLTNEANVNVGGAVMRGGAIYINSTNTITIKGSTFEANKVIYDGSINTKGGAIYSESSPMVVENSTFNNNIADSDRGGAIWANAGITVTSCTFYKNSALLSGGAVAVNCDGTFTSCSFLNNTARYGGAIQNGSNLIIVKNCRFDQNIASYSGGSVDGGAIEANSASIESCVFSSNEANDPTGSGSVGGALFIYSDSIVRNCVFYDNKCKIVGSANSFGGAIYCNAAGTTIKIINCTVVSNESISTGGTGYGGGIYFDSAAAPFDISVMNCIIRGNIADTNIAMNNITFAAQDYNDIDDAAFTGSHTINQDPKFTGSIPYTSEDNFKLTSLTSTDVSQGGTTGADIPTTDYSGNTRGIHPSMGAFEKI